MKRQLILPVLAAALIVCLPDVTQAQKNIRKGLISMHMEPVIIEAVPVEELASALKKHTRLEVSPDLEEATPVQFFYAIARGGEIVGPFASDRVFAREGTLAPKRGRAITTPWDAFEEPIFGFEEPILGFDDPLLGLENPRALIINHEEQYSSPEEALRVLWGAARGFAEEEHYRLVLYAMSMDGRTPVLQDALLCDVDIRKAGTR